MQKAKSLPLIILLGVLFGTNLVSARFALGQFGTNTFNALRMLSVSVCYLLIYALSSKRKFPRGKMLWLHGSVFGIFGLALPMTAFISSMNYQSSGVTSLLVTLNTPVTLIMAQIFLGDKALSGKKLAGVLLAFAGAGLVLLKGETGLAELAKADGRAYILVAVGIICTSGSLIYARRFLKNENEFDTVAIRIISGALVLAPLALLTDNFDLSRVQTSGWGALAYSAMICTFFAFLLEFYLIKKFGAAEAAQSSYVIPVVAAILGALLLGEQITLTIVIGMIAIFSGLRLLNTN